MRRQRSTKIVATLGPASSTPERIEALFRAGVDVFRLNFSHGSHEDHRARVQTIRALEQSVGRPISILLDLQGPKLRLGTFRDGKALLKEGAEFRLELDPAPGDDKRAPLPHPEIFAAIGPGAELLIDDGRIRLRIEDSGRDYCLTRVVTGGIVSDRKGVNVPGVVLPLSPLTDKDRRDLAFGLDLGVDWVALSFALLAKLEKPAAIDRLDEIVELCDAIMVARGDLGVEMPPEDVPALQKRIIRSCRTAGKPVIVATQMLDSMVNAPAPTRAEASDVATAVYDGTDAVMLSAETASGNYPIEAVTMMNRIVSRTERDPLYRRLIDADHAEPEATAADAITAAARQIGHTIKAAAIVTYTTSGSTTLRAARERPDVPILCLTQRLATARRLSLAWGVHSVVTEDINNFQEMVAKAVTVARHEEFARPGDRLVVTAGVPFGTPGATNILRIAWVGD
jgi:pyruvate kinase